MLPSAVTMNSFSSAASIRVRRALDLRSPHDLRFLAGRVDRFHDSRPADIQPAARLDMHVELRRQFPKLTKDAAEIVRNLVLAAVRRDVGRGSFLERIRRQVAGHDPRRSLSYITSGVITGWRKRSSSRWLARSMSSRVQPPGYSMGL